MRRFRRLFLLALGALTSAWLSCERETTVGPEPPAVAVVVATAERADVPIEARIVGSVVPVATVEIAPQVQGVLERAYFEEGAAVKKGDLLFSIDARPFRAALAEAEATMASNKAQRDQAAVDAIRYSHLADAGVAPEEQASLKGAAAKSAEATVEANQAAVERARLDLAYTQIRSPISGRTGILIIDPGNVVTTTDRLVAIRQISPIEVQFAVPESYFAAIKAAQARGELGVEVTPREISSTPIAGAVTVVDNTIATSTGTINLKARFENQDEALWPGAFVDVALHVGVERGVVTVPETAVEPGQAGSHVFVMKPNRRVVERKVDVARVEAGRAVIRSGVAAGEVVVSRGTALLREGIQVQPTSGGQ